jgi:hypothetical protein
MNTDHGMCLETLRLTSARKLGVVDTPDALYGTLIREDGVRMRMVFASVASARTFINEMGPPNIELDCLPDERTRLEWDVRNHPLLS